VPEHQTTRADPIPIQTVEHWEEKARQAEEAAEAMRHAPARFSMLEIAQLYRQLAERTRKLTEAQRDDVHDTACRTMAKDG
jgi:predicted HAD superfamily phosphohydrolase